MRPTYCSVVDSLLITQTSMLSMKRPPTPSLKGGAGWRYGAKRGRNRLGYERLGLPGTRHASCPSVGSSVSQPMEDDIHIAELRYMYIIFHRPQQRLHKIGLVNRLLAEQGRFPSFAYYLKNHVFGLRRSLFRVAALGFH